MNNFLQINKIKGKINVQVAGLEPARCVSIVQLRAECVYQFRHTCKSKIRNGSINLNRLAKRFSVFIFQFRRFYQ